MGIVGAVRVCAADRAVHLVFYVSNLKEGGLVLGGYLQRKLGYQPNGKYFPCTPP